MSTTLRVLLVEDNDDDAFLVTRALRRGGIVVEIERVETREAYIAALDCGQCDIVLSDYLLPGFGGMEALAIVKMRRPDLPFILVSGTIGEEIAVQSIHAGADDYLLKQNLVRLVPAVHRAIREARHRQQKDAAEKALVENRERLELIFNSVFDVLVLVSLDEHDLWRYTAVNRAALTKLQEVGLAYSSSDLLGQEAMHVENDLFRLDAESVAWLSGMREQVKLGRAAQTVERKFNSPVGVYAAEFSFVPSLDSKGDTEHILMDVRDITAQRRAEQHERQLQEKVNEAQRLESLGTLASGVAHDFNNLLTGIMGFAELANHSKDPSEIKQHCEQIVQISAQARELVRRILTFARPGPAKDVSIPFCESVRELMSLVLLSLPGQVTVDVQIADCAAHVGLDTNQLLQVLLNLVTNANQAMPQGGRLTIAAESIQITDPIPADLYPLEPGEHAKLVVADTGYGIAPDILPKVFDPFFTTKPAGQGTGIGLTTVHQIVRSLHGAIRVTSAPQQGATFEIYLPVVDHATAPSSASPSVPVSSGRPVIAACDEQTLASLEAAKGKLTAALTQVEYEKEKVAEHAATLTGELAKTKSELRTFYQRIIALRNDISELQTQISAKTDAR
jgi:two-component system cell cycle sensor histidine kinase/response regulator CckA